MGCLEWFFYLFHLYQKVYHQQNCGNWNGHARLPQVIDQNLRWTRTNCHLDNCQSFLEVSQHQHPLSYSLDRQNRFDQVHFNLLSNLIFKDINHLCSVLCLASFLHFAHSFTLVRHNTSKICSECWLDSLIRFTRSKSYVYVKNSLTAILLQNKLAPPINFEHTNC